MVATTITRARIPVLIQIVARLLLTGCDGVPGGLGVLLGRSLYYLSNYLITFITSLKCCYSVPGSCYGIPGGFCVDVSS